MSLFSSKETATLTVTGMHCEKCVARVTAALEAIDGVTSVQVSLEDERAVVEGRGFSVDALVEAVVAQGFGAELAAPAE